MDKDDSPEIDYFQKFINEIVEAESVKTRVQDKEKSVTTPQREYNARYSEMWQNRIRITGTGIKK